MSLTVRVVEGECFFCSGRQLVVTTSAVYSIQCTVYSIQYTALQCTVYSITVYSVQCRVYSITVYSIQYTVSILDLCHPDHEGCPPLHTPQGTLFAQTRV